MWKNLGFMYGPNSSGHESKEISLDSLYSQKMS